MAILTNTVVTYDQIGKREQLADVISRVAPEETPFYSNLKRKSVKGTFNEWLIDELAAADGANVVVEGDEATFDAAVQPTRVGNYQQISRKTVISSETAEAVDKAGRASELAYQVAKKGVELKRDIETMLLANQGAVAGGSAQARRTAGLPVWYQTNVSMAGDGANADAPNPAPTDTRTDGTLRSITEVILKEELHEAWQNGAKVDGMTFMVSGTVKQTVSGFDGIATSTVNLNGAQKSVIIGAADVYVSDFGKITVVPNRFQRARDGHLLDFDYLQLDVLRPIHKVKLAKTGDSEKSMVIGEYGLRVKNEAGLALIADIQA